MCPYYFSFSDQCLIQGQPPYNPLVEERLHYCLNNNYVECERYRLFRDPNFMTSVERRNYRRVLFQMAGKAFTEGKHASVETVDISLGGLRIRSDSFIEPGKCVDFAFNAGEEGELELHGCVRWATPREADEHWTLGIQFNPGLVGKSREIMERLIWGGKVL